MHIPVVVGVIIAIILLVTFSGWFYHLSSGWSQILVDDAYFKYRIFAATALSGLVVTATFFGLAYAIDCPAGDDGGAFKGMNCQQYLKIKTSAEEVLSQKNNPNKPTVLPGEEDVSGELFFGK